MSANAHTTAISGGKPAPIENTAVSAAARTCGSCSFYGDAGDPLGRPTCESRDARTFGAPSFPLAGFGCIFHHPADPGAYRAALVDAGVIAVFRALYAQAGRSALPEGVESIGKATRERLEIAVVRVLQAAKVLP